MSKFAKLILFLILPIKSFAGMTVVTIDRLNDILYDFYGFKNLDKNDIGNSFANSNGLIGGNGLMDHKYKGKIWGYMKDGKLVELEGVAIQNPEGLENSRND